MNVLKSRYCCSQWLGINIPRVTKNQNFFVFIPTAEKIGNIRSVNMGKKRKYVFLKSCFDANRFVLDLLGLLDSPDIYEQGSATEVSILARPNPPPLRDSSGGRY